MTDGAIAPDPTLSPADRAVTYLLDRCQHDAELRWHLLGTQAFALLVAAEALRLKVEPDFLRRIRQVWCGPGRSESEMLRLRALLEERGIDWR